MEVVIDGITYAPVGVARPSIGVGITTFNRPDVREKALAEWRRFLPADAKLVLVDDASTPAAPGADFRFEKQAGIARAKNKCLELLADCEHIFLADDDTYPLCADWWKPYVESSEPHLMYVFPDAAGPLKIAEDEQHVAWSDPRGCLLYVHRSVLETVGGMDPAYGMWGHEHVDWSNRIQNAGLTSWRFQDVVGSDKLIHCDDQDGIERSVPQKVRDEHHGRNKDYYFRNIDSARYVEFRQQRDVVLACWQHGPDRQRSNKVTTLSGKEAAKTLRASVKGADFVLLADDGTGDVKVKPPVAMDIYNSRWAHYRTWLRDHPEVRYVWCCDANDVVMQKPPWDEMQPGTLYMGWEAEIIGSPWMLERHKDATLTKFINANADKMLLNCGLIGGDRATMLQLLTQWARLVEMNAQARREKKENADLGTDMAPMNYVVYGKFLDRLVTGPKVATVFKADKANNHSWWKHK